MRRLLLAVAVSLACTSNAAKKPPVDQFPPGAQGAVLQHHGDAARSGIYVDAVLTRAAVRNLRQDTAFSATYQGPVYAQPLYWDAGTGGQDLLLVFTERNEVIAFNPLTGARIARAGAAGLTRRAALRQHRPAGYHRHAHHRSGAQAALRRRDDHRPAPPHLRARAKDG